MVRYIEGLGSTGKLLSSHGMRVFAGSLVSMLLVPLHLLLYDQ